MTLLQVLRDRTGVDFDTMSPLYDTVEPDAVDRFVNHAARSTPTADSHLQFPVGDYLVRLSADGTVEFADIDATDATVPGGV